MQVGYRGLWESSFTYYRGAHINIILFSLASRSTFENLDYWIALASRYSEIIPIVIVGNKRDLMNEREVSMDEAQSFVESKGLIYIEISAKEYIEVEELFRTIVELINYALNFQLIS
jgi:Ras-related protein Rab-4B